MSPHSLHSLLTNACRGCVSQDGRLQVNDQLLEVNDQLLATKTNAEAMEVLRQAMHKEGPTPGYIKLAVARRMPASMPLVDNAPYELRVSHSEPPHEPHNHLDSAEVEEITTRGKFRNPALDRVGSEAHQLRNESYQRATHDSMMTETDDSVFGASRPAPRMSSPTIAGRQMHTVMIEDDSTKPIVMVHTYYFTYCFYAFCVHCSVENMVSCG